MTDLPPIPAAPVAASSPIRGEQPHAQMIISLAIVAAITVNMIALTIAGVVTKQWVLVSGVAGTGLASLATALKVPTGITNALAMSKKADAQ